MNLGVIDEGNQQRPYQSQYSDSFGRSFGTDSGIVIMESEVTKFTVPDPLNPWNSLTEILVSMKTLWVRKHASQRIYHTQATQ